MLLVARAVSASVIETVIGSIELEESSASTVTMCEANASWALTMVAERRTSSASWSEPAEVVIRRDP